MDTMAYTKLNRLHLHASDAQSWPLEIPTIPSLSKKGAYRPDLTWSATDLAAVQTHAAEIGIEIIIKIDSPGHTASIAYAYLNLIAAFNQQPWLPYAAEPPSGQVKLNDSGVYAFMDALYADLLPRLSPFSASFHAGGDELNAQVYALDPTVNSNASHTIQPYLQAFLSHLHAAVRRQASRRRVGGDAADIGPHPPPRHARPAMDVGLAAPRPRERLHGHVRELRALIPRLRVRGFLDALSSNTSTSTVAPLYADWCSPLKSWRQIYSYDPRVNNSAHLHQQIIGGGDPGLGGADRWGESRREGLAKGGGGGGGAVERAEGGGGVNWGVTRRLAEFRKGWWGGAGRRECCRWSGVCRTKGGCAA
ncbi:N-acetyl-glucosamine-6-phosphate deacetylase [Lambiella insularis]|nr:N-acetyl-glucosamine-6-phosphate deacetylase [Lambiella insularis]